MIVELIGPAGAGKSTLLRALRRHDPQLSFFADRLPARKPENIPFYLENGLRALPMLGRLYYQGTRLSREEVSRILYLQGMPRFFSHQLSPHLPTVVDQGPIFELTQLQAFGTTALHTAVNQPWWEQLYQQWANRLLLAVWLDAPDEVLLPRIRSRAQEHRIKHLADQAATAMLARYRQTFGSVMAQLQRHAQIPILRLMSAETAVETLAAQVSDAIQMYRTPIAVGPEARQPYFSFKSKSS